MISTIKTLSAGARNWWREYCALPSDRKHLFVAVALGLVLAYFVVSTMSWKRGQVEGQQEIISALSNITPAVESIRASCRNRWESSDCGLFYLLRERGR